jgi:hypothetical protein
MPPTLHPHLKRGLDLDEFYTCPEDVIAEPSAEYRDPEQQAAKRRRVEAIAAQYLRGRPPVILTAGLRGPFNNGWKNPWAKPKGGKRRTSDKSIGTVDSRDGRSRIAASRKDTAANGRIAGVGGRKEDRVAKEIPAPRVASPPRIASPETSRAAQDDLDIRERDSSLDGIEVPPATAPLPNEDELSGATEFFSANTERCIQNRSPETNPFWIRRPDSARVDMRKSTNGNTDVSPSRSRSREGHSQSQMKVGLRVSLPKAPIRAQSAPQRVVVPEEWRSSASASTNISSPFKDMDTARSETNASAVAAEQLPKGPNDLQIPTAATMQNTPHSPGIGTEAGRCAQRIIPVVTSSMGSQGRPSRDDIQWSAERLVDLMPTSSASSRQPARSSRKGTPSAAAPVAVRHDHVASPGPASSNGFVHSKIGQLKQQGGNVKRARPRAVDFNSSPALKQKPAPVLEHSLENMTTIQEAVDVTPVQDNVEPEEVTAEPPEQAEADAEVTDLPNENLEIHESRSSRNSDWSTQAAMLRAQLEFQQSTFPTMSPEGPRLWSQPSQDTPRPMLTVPSPAITPMSVFSAHEDNTQPNRSVLRGPPISTQDLFGAASPFAFSTVKKKPEGSQRSSLRFSFLPCDGGDSMLNDATTKSPTPSAPDRIPLKDKNTTTFWSFEKASQGSQKSLGDILRRSVNDIELPQLDFHTSLDDFGPNGNLHFTDRFLRNIEDT